MKLVIHEHESELARDLFRSADELACASIGYVEARSALSRLNRDESPSPARRDDVRAHLEQLWSETHVIELDDLLVRAAADTAEMLRLNAGDAIHLASALTIDEPKLVFATWDGELRRAALEAGLAVAP